MNQSFGSRKSSSAISAANRAPVKAPEFETMSSHPATLSKLAISSTTRSIVTGSVSRPPSDLGNSILVNPERFNVSITGFDSRRSVSARGACSRISGPSSRAFATSVSSIAYVMYSSISDSAWYHRHGDAVEPRVRFDQGNPFDADVDEPRLGEL